MAANVRQLIKSLTEHVFPVNRRELERLEAQRRKTGFEYVSNLPLQMLIYFNCFYAPFWFISSLVALILEFVYKVINTAIFSLYAVLEGPRLYLGFCGNLMETVPELVGSWLITLLIQLPAISIMIFNPYTILTSFERVIHAVELIFILLEIFVGFFVIKLLVRHQALKFHMRVIMEKHDKSARGTN
ncbi:Transmembrane protein 17 [Fasciola gigantica]|uniref:Transmembrane protein 17 n=1 Tax=Fasciola gigantica TaxID=46835 RepID=A0A504Z3Z0_FASGI|nr:Transmembrane protein 17 [Fasciola gigantica]